jgi:hypothetical protein
MSRQDRFFLGAIGGLLPVLATLVAVDLSSIQALIDNHGITEGLVVGYSIRVVGLFALGGIMAAINTATKDPIALVQIGIAAPALVTSYLSGAAITKNQPNQPLHAATFSFGISVAHAQQPSNNKVQFAGGFLSDVVNGITPGLGKQLDDIHRQIGNPLEHIQPLNVPYTVISIGTSYCLDIPADSIKSSDDYEKLIKAFPSSNYLVQPGQCKK